MWCNVVHNTGHKLTAGSTSIRNEDEHCTLKLQSCECDADWWSGNQLLFKPPPPVSAGGGYMFSGRASVRASVRP